MKKLKLKKKKKNKEQKGESKLTESSESAGGDGLYNSSPEGSPTSWKSGSTSGTKTRGGIQITLEQLLPYTRRSPAEIEHTLKTEIKNVPFGFL